MDRKHPMEWLGYLWHLSDEELVLNLDGELGPRKQRRVSRHIKECWSCRARYDRMERAISEFVEYRESEFRAALPPDNWMRFPGKLQRASQSSARRRSWFGRRYPFSRRCTHLNLAIALGCVLVFCAALYLTSPSTVSAKEVLRRAEAEDVRRIALVKQPVIYQKLEVRRRSNGSPESVSLVEIWADHQHARFRQRETQALYRELGQILSDNGMDPQFPLSAAVFASWGDSTMRGAEPSVIKLRSGAPALLIETRRSSGSHPSPIVEARLVVRESDWHPVQEVLSVWRDGGISEYELQEEDFRILDAKAIDPELFAGSGAPIAATPTVPPNAAKPAHSGPSTAPLPVDRDTLDEAELQARYALHRASACLGGLVEVLRDPAGKIDIRGLTESPESKERLLAELGTLVDLPFVRVDLKTLEEASAQSGTVTEVATEANDSQQVVSGKLGVEDLLKSKAGLDAGAITRLSNVVVAAADLAMSEAWALRHLAERYPSSTRGELRQPSRWLLETMIRDHARALESQVTRLNDALEPLRLSVANGGVDLMDADLRGFNSVCKAQALAHDLFAGEPLADSVESASAQLVHLLPRLVEELKQLGEGVADLAGDWRR